MIFLNLAALNYSKLLKDSKSPLDFFNVYEVKEENFFYFEVHSFLKENCKSKKVEVSDLYGDADATGTHNLKHIAMWKSFSELIERWCFHFLIEENSARYGMSIDKTTTGFSALPCWPKSTVRRFSYSEAAERWIISNWWLEKIKPTFVNFNKQYIVFELADVKGFTVIVYDKVILAGKEHYCYGFAHGFRKTDAFEKASVEMNRNKRVIKNYQNKKITNISDKRLMYFAGEEGHSLFLKRVEKIDFGKISLPKLIVDCSIKGPWSEYATVWRCLLADTDYNWKDPTHFMF